MNLSDKTQQIEEVRKDLRYLQLLSNSFPTSAEASTEIINLEAILNLPKGTEHFLADIHGEHEAFDHVLRNASGSVMRKIKELFDRSMLKQEMATFALLVYYPQEALHYIKQKVDKKDLNSWYKVNIDRLVQLCRKASEKYTRSKVRKNLPEEYSYILQELLHEKGDTPNKVEYIASILDTIILTGKADDFIIALSTTIQRLVVDHLHIVGDIYDRGPGAHFIMDNLLRYHHVDIQWGNHDVLWMGAASGNWACIANLLRISLRYANLDTIEDGYGINLLPLARFAMETYANDPCKRFQPKTGDSDVIWDDKSMYLISQMQKAMAVIQFKLEYAIIKDHPEYKMDSRNLLHKIDWEKGTVDLSETAPNGGYGIHPMLDMNFPTVDPKDPYKLTEEELNVMERLSESIRRSEKLHRHIRGMYSLGSMFLVCNDNLLFHASMPLDEDGMLKEVTIGKKKYKGKALFEKVDALMRDAYFSPVGSPERKFAGDYVWYLWCGPDSPLFDKSAMTTFERYFVADKVTHTETKGYYYKYRSNVEAIDRILADFGLSGSGCHIINGHVPVKTTKGEKPILADGKVLVIDGGFSRAYQPTTGIAGYTLIYNSQGLQLVQHEPFIGKKNAIKNASDIKSVSVLWEPAHERIMVRNTDVGRTLQTQIDNLKNLLYAYRVGLIKERPQMSKNKN